MAVDGHYKGKGGTKQGIYVMSPGGQLLASANTLNAEKVLEMMERGLAAWEALPVEARKLPPAVDLTPAHRWEDSLPRNGLVLRSTKRDLAESCSADADPNATWNRDHVWFSFEEQRLLESALEWDDPYKVSFTLPSVLVQRLAHYSLVDSARGQTLPFAPSEVVEAKLAGRITHQNAGEYRFEMSGTVLCETDGVWLLGQNDWTPKGLHPRGMHTVLYGEAVYDKRNQRFTEFELVAQSLRWGITPNSGRWRNPDPNYIGTWFTLAPQTPAGRVAPAFIDLYAVDWLKRPGQE